MVAKEVSKRYQTMTDVIAALEGIQQTDVPATTASSPGIQPVAGGANVDSGVASFLNHLDGEKAATDQTVIAPVEQVVLDSDTFADSSDQLTQQRLNPTKMLSREQQQRLSSKKQKLIISSSVAAVLVVGALIWSFSGGTGDKPEY